MKKIGLIVILVALAIGGYYFWQNSHETKKIKPETIFVSIARPIQTDTTVSAKVVGNVSTHTTVSVKSLVDGQLISKNFNSGDFVKAGQVLFEIDPRPFKVALEQAKATLSRDQALLLQAKSSFDRNSKLVKFGYVSKQDFDTLQANRDSLQATVQADKASIDNAALQLSYCTITAPITGRAGNVLIDVGNIIKTGESSVLVVINQISPIDIKFSISEKQFPQIQDLLKQGSVEVQVQLQQDTNIIKSGKLTFIDNTIDTTTGMIQLKAAFPNEDHYLWPGQFVNVTIPLANIKQAILIPTRALQVGQTGAYVFVVGANNTVQIRPIVVGPAVSNNTVITSGLKANEIVVTEGQLNLTANSKVQFNQADLTK